MMKQLCSIKIDEGEYDSVIAMMIRQDFKDDSIMRELMVLTKGHENPSKVKDRITAIRKSNET